jgi:hypothetical protein
MKQSNSNPRRTEMSTTLSYQRGEDEVGKLKEERHGNVWE